MSLVLVLMSGVGMARAQIIEYPHLDALSSMRAVTDGTGRVIERHDYLPFGEEWDPASPKPEAQPLRFTGKERDTETGLDYFGARYYGSKMARFTTVDPVHVLDKNLVDPQRWNRYAYGRNNPQRFFDPDGRAVLELKPLSPETVARNARIRNAIDAFLNWDPLPQDHALGAMVKGFFPTSQAEVKLDTILNTAADVMAPLEGPALSASSAAMAGRLRNQLTAEEIAAGHAFVKHVLEQGELAGLGIRTRAQFRSHAETVLSEATSVRYYRDGRTVYLHEPTGTVVIRNPGSGESTGFQPQNWSDYVAGLPQRTTPY